MSLLQKALSEPAQSKLGWMRGLLSSQVEHLGQYVLDHVPSSKLTFPYADILVTDLPFVLPEPPGQQPPDLQLQLNSCLERVHKKYFSHDYSSNYGKLGRQLHLLQSEVAQLNEQLDEVEIVLFYNANSKHLQLLKLLDQINALERAYSSCLQRVAGLRRVIHEAKQKIVAHSKTILGLASKKRRVSSLLGKVKHLKELADLQKRVQQMASRNEVKQASDLIKRCESEFKGLRVAKLSCLKNIDQLLSHCRVVLREQVRGRTVQSLVQFLTAQLSYNKGGLQSQSVQPLQLEEEKEADLLESVWVEQTVAIFSRAARSLQAERALVASVLQSQFAVKAQSLGLLQVLCARLQTFRKTFLADVAEVISSESSVLQQSNLDFTKLSPEYHCRLLQIFSQLLMRVTKRFIDLLGTFFTQYQSLREERSAALEVLQYLVETARAHIEFCNQQLIGFVKLKPVSQDLDFLQFKGISNVLGEWERLGAKDLFPGLKSREADGLALTVRFDSFKLVRFQLESHYAKIVSDSALGKELRESLLGDDWNPVSIDVVYAETIGLLLNGAYLSKAELQNSVFLESELSVNASRRGGRVLVPIDEGPPRRHRAFRIIKDTIHIEQSRFKVSRSMLTLLDIAEDFTKLAALFPHLEHDMRVRLAELVRFYSQVSKQLVLLGGAKDQPAFKNRNLSTKNLALCSRSLEFLAQLVPSLLHKCKPDEVAALQQALLAHSLQIVDKISEVASKKITLDLKKLDSEVRVQSLPTKSTTALLTSLKTISEVAAQYFPEDQQRSLMGRLEGTVREKYFEGLRELARAEQLRRRVGQELQYFGAETGWMGASRLQLEAESLREQLAARAERGPGP